MVVFSSWQKIHEMEIETFLRSLLRSGNMKTLFQSKERKAGVNSIAWDIFKASVADKLFLDSIGLTPQPSCFARETPHLKSH